MKKLFILVSIVLAASSYEIDDIVSARIETCRGCSLNRLPQVKSFVMQDAPQYERVEVQFITGAPPELVLLGAGDRELERLPLSHLDRQQCNDLLHDKGFFEKPQKADL